MVNKYEFNKQFSNMGIDKESIMDIGKNNKENKMKEEESQEINLIKRKLDYLQNNIMNKFNEKFEELEKKIDAKKNDSVELNRDLTSMRNDIADLKKKIKNIRIVFSEEEIVKKSNNQSSEKTEKDSKDIKVEDYFNFSNKKFD